MADAYPMKIAIYGPSGEMGVFTLNEHLGLVIPDEAGMALIADDDPIIDPRNPDVELWYTDGKRFMDGLLLRFSGAYVRAHIVQDDEPLALMPVPMAMAGAPVSGDAKGSRMFTFKLELEDGTPADPSTFTAAVPDWKAGDTIPLGPGRSLRVVAVREGVLVVTVS